MKTGSKLVLFALLILVNVGGIVTSARQEQGKVPPPLATESATPSLTTTATEVTPTPTVTGEFTATPSATPIEIIVTVIAVNSGFERNLDGDAVPDKWEGKNLEKDRQTCNKVNRPGKPDKIVAYEGNCAFEFKDGGGKLIQTRLIHYGDANHIIRVSGVSAAKNLSAAYKLVVKLTYSDSTTHKFFLMVDSGTYDYSAIDAVSTLSAPVIKTKLMIRGGTGLGRLRLDNVNLGTHPDPFSTPER